MRVQAEVDRVERNMLTTLAGIMGKTRGDLVRDAVRRYLGINAWRLQPPKTKALDTDQDAR